MQHKQAHIENSPAVAKGEWVGEGRAGNCGLLLLVQRLSCVRLFATHGLQPTRLLCPWAFPGKNTGVGCPFLLQGIFLTQESNTRLLSWPGEFFTTESPGKPGLRLANANNYTQDG